MTRLEEEEVAEEELSAEDACNLRQSLLISNHYCMVDGVSGLS